MKINYDHIFYAIVILIVIGSIVLVILRYWPRQFTIKNNTQKDITVDVYLNETKIDGNPIKIPANSSTKVTIRATNPRTNVPYRQSQMKSMAVYLPVDSDITFQSGNLGSYSIIRSPNLAGFLSENISKGTPWQKAGYYVITFN